MINETFKKAMRGKGKQILGCAFAINLIFHTLNVIILNAYNASTVKTGSSRFLKATMLDLGLTMTAICIGLIVVTGFIGSWNDLMKESEVSIKNYLKNSKKLILRYIGYSILLGFPSSICSYIIRAMFGFSVTDISALSNDQYLITLAVVNVFINSVTLPLLILLVLRYEDKLPFLKVHFLKILLINAINQVVTFIPYIGGITAVLINLLLMALILSWYHEWSKANIVNESEVFM